MATHPPIILRSSSTLCRSDQRKNARYFKQVTQAEQKTVGHDNPIGAKIQAPTIFALLPFADRLRQHQISIFLDVINKQFHL
ncbi:unnamed protein product [Protopolystoma xenopodis]|uniref:Uncharacterized protein n=1 Tax=Protopolystoma xenopodis TaxID=117903 RepID=A0A3S5CMD0_9PLAT|nr:unnamed protein product [Protopolystoma xenopodis]